MAFRKDERDDTVEIAVEPFPHELKIIQIGKKSSSIFFRIPSSVLYECVVMSSMADTRRRKYSSFFSI